jgi:hypothetical protein
MRTLMSIAAGVLLLAGVDAAARRHGTCAEVP